MHRSRFSLFALAALSLACATFYRAVAWIERGVAWAFTLIDRPALGTSKFGGVAFAGNFAPSYAAPTAHSLRHEAGTARRAAARNI